MFDRKYLLVVVLVAVLFALAIHLSMSMVEGFQLQAESRIVALTLPLIPLMIGGFYLEWCQFKRFDELQRQIHMIALMLASGALVVYCAFGVVLEELGGMQGFPLIGALLVHGVSYFVAVFVLRWYYK